MAIIYSYPATAPTLDDLLIGTDVGADNATKSFTVQSLVALINAEAGSGTVTDVTISTGAFLSATKTSQPGAPAITYTLELVDNGTTPNATNFYRGDGKWVVPTVTSGISVFNSGVLVTSDLSSADFRGAGVTTSSDASGNVIINIEGAINAVESIVAGTGIGLSGATGNVIVTNTGITGLSQGNGISISTTAGGVSTIATTGQSTGTVTSVSVGAGLSLLSGTSTVNPTIGLDYTGADTYITQPAAAVPLEADFIPFHSVTGTAVKKVTFGDIQASTLALVNTSISDTDADNIKNNTDLLPSVNKVLNVITLTAAEYTAIGAGNYVAGTLYLTTAAAQAQNTVNFTINTAAINYTGSCNFTQSTTVNGSVVNPIAVTGSVGSAYSVATTIIPNGASCSLNGSATQTLTGTIPATPTPAAVTHTLAARTISAPASPGQSTNTMVLNTNAITGAEFTTNAPRTATGTTGDPFQATDFGLVATANTNYEFTGGAATVSGLYTPTASTYGGTSITGYFNATTVSAKDYPVNYTVTPNISGIQNYNITITGGTFSAPATSGSTTAPYGSTVTVKAQITPTGTDVISPNPLEVTGSVQITSSTANTIDLGTLTGAISSSSGFVQMNENISASGPGASSVVGAYSFDGVAGYIAGTQKSGTVGTTSPGFAASFTYDSSLYFISSSSANITPTSTPVYATTVAPVTANVTVATANRHGFSSSIASIGGSNTAPGTGGSACNYGATITVYTDASASSGLSVGQMVYSSPTSNTPYSTNTLAWWKTGAPGGTQLVNFNSSGAVAAIGSC